MIERAEAVTLARQIGETLAGSRIAMARRENSPHKWAFYSRSKDEYETLPVGKRIGDVVSHGNLVSIQLTPGYVMQLGDGGERILLLDATAPLPQKYHLLWEFEDGRRLVVSVMGWGRIRLFDSKQYRDWLKEERQHIDPLDESFTYDVFKQAMAEYTEACNKPLKAMLTSEARIHGIGNGYPPPRRPASPDQGAPNHRLEKAGSL